MRRRQYVLAFTPAVECARLAAHLVWLTVLLEFSAIHYRWFVGPILQPTSSTDYFFWVLVGRILILVGTSFISEAVAILITEAACSAEMVFEDRRAAGKGPRLDHQEGRGN